MEDTQNRKTSSGTKSQRKKMYNSSDGVANRTRGAPRVGKTEKR